jgi:cyanophycinase-like exopeptidase
MNAVDVDFVTDSLAYIYCVAARDRMGRSLTFLARCKTDLKLSEFRSMGVDEKTALLFDVNTGVAKAVGSNNAFICSSPSVPICVVGKPLQMNGMFCCYFIC